jgi:hypothetical protein
LRKSLDQFLRREVDQRLRTSPHALIEGRLPLLHEAPEDRVDRVVREQKRVRAIWVGERPLAASRMMCILNLRLGLLSRFI